VSVDPLAVLTAKMTANTAGDGGRTRTATELQGPTAHCAEPQRTPADTEPTVFKTVRGALQGVLGGFDSHPSPPIYVTVTANVTATVADIGALWWRVSNGQVSVARESGERACRMADPAAAD
jgi:hypothetical protein